MNNKLLLEIDLIPSSSFFKNIRSSVSKKQWDTIRNFVYSRAYHVCEICGGIGKKHPVEAHEIFSYDEKSGVQKLEKLIALCPNCHRVCHFGLAQLQGFGEQALKHLIKINQITKQQAEQHIKEAFSIWEQRNKIKWILDLFLLKTDFNIDTR